MDYSFKDVTVYADSKENLWIVPSGSNERWGGTIEIDIVHHLVPPYSHYDLGIMLMTAFAECYSKKYDWNSNRSAIEKFLGVKGYAKAVSGKKLVSISWKQGKGYEVTPTKKEQKPKRGYVHMEDKILNLNEQATAEQLGEAVKEAIRISTS